MGSARNICLVGHSGCGKTTLATALMKRAGTKEIGLDASQEEQERGHTLDLGVGTFQAKDLTITLLDTPGGDEFIEEMYKAIPVADLTLLVVSADRGVEVVTERAWNVAEAGEYPMAVLVNQMDKEGADFDKVLAELRESFDGKFVPIHLPIREGTSFAGMIDVMSNQAVNFADKSKKGIPSEHAAAAEEARATLMEEAAGFDDELMMKFLEEEPITEAEAAAALSAGVASGKLIPVLCCSATEEKGLDSLIKEIGDLVPGASASADAPTRAILFSLTNDPYLGRLSFFRVLEGTLQEGKALVNVADGHKVDLRDLYAFEGTKQHRVSSAGPGEIVAAGKLEDLDIGTTVAATPEAEAYPMPEFPKPVFPRHIVPKTQADVEKMSEALREVGATKATIVVDRDPVTKELIAHGMGDIHLTLFLERLKNRYNVNLEAQQPRIPYKETIRKKATARYRHKKQSGGRGQFGECELRLEPFTGEGGYQFLNEIKGASIPGQYIPGVEKGVIEAMEEGNLAKYPVTNVTVAVFDGQYHDVDSSELAFKIAARNAFRQAFDQAQPCLLEPVMAVQVRVPEEFTGDIISDLNGRRGRIQGMDPAGKVTVIRAEVPLAEMQSYALDLKSRTQGRATFQMDFSSYQNVPSNIQERIIAAARQEEE